VWNLLRSEARVVLARNWPAVEAVADALIERKTLDGAEVAATVIKSVINDASDA
jgi:hypothetical protein